MPRNKKGKRPTIQDVAKYAGVSIATVSRVLNSSAPVDDEKTQRVVEAIAQLNYRPRAAARMLPTLKTHTIGVLVPLISGDFISQMLYGIERGVIDDGFDLLIHSTSLSSKPNDPFKRVLGEQNSDGLIIFSDSLDTDELTRLAENQFPVVLLHRSSPPGLHIPSVTVRNKSGARTIVEHLITVHNRKKIVFLRGPEGHEDSHWREVGYLQALEAYHITPDPSLIGLGEFASADSERTTKRLIAEGVQFDAVFAGDDESASGALIALRQAGIKVPDEVSVVGFDNSKLAQHLVPPLTTVDAHVEEAGYAAAKQLVNLINQKPAQMETLLPTQLVIRNSCGCT